MTQVESSIAASFEKKIKQNATVAMILGALTAFMGAMLLTAPVLTGLSVASIAGFVVVIAGVSQLVFAFKAGEGFWPYVGGVLTLVIGAYLAGNPVLASAILTIVLAIYFLASGISEILLSLQIKPVSGWGWMLFTGILSVLLGFMIWAQFPFSGAMAVGVFLGIKLLFSGVTLVALGFAARSATKSA
jgi:uncharacterized membrane protein HdeD (DUF308 family)